MTKIPSSTLSMGSPKLPMGLRGGLIHSQFHSSVRAPAAIKPQMFREPMPSQIPRGY